MSILKCIESQYQYAVTKRCAEAGCKLDLSDLKGYVLLKGETLNPNQSMCDCLIFLMKNSVLIVGVVELKSKTVNLSQVISQLANGIKCAFEAINECRGDWQAAKLYVAVLANRWSASVLKTLKNRYNSRIEFHGEKFPILTRGCGTRFSEIFK